jgi:rhamnogalacturonan endolyase
MHSQLQKKLMENLGRGVVAVRTSSTQVYVGWRLLGTDPGEIAFYLYRSTGGGTPVKVNNSVITATTDFVDSGADLTQSNGYFVRPVIGGVEQAASAAYTLPVNAPTQQYLSVPLQIPAGGTTPDNVTYTYNANDCSVGDLDGDGEYEIVLKWDSSNSKDNAQSGYTGNVFLDAYKLNGTRLWRIDLGRNIRAGAHYTQFMVYDLDGDGKAEVACKTADGTIDGTGRVIGNPNADYRNASGYVLSGPEFLTIFNGMTGAALATTDYVPPRGNVADWGDNYGNRVDRFLACIAYLDGRRPSLVMCRGYYTRTVLAAWNWRDGQLTRVWTFDSRDGTPGNLAYEGQGNHNLSVGDVDGDGRDEIVYGACAIDHDGSGLYSTGLGHGDAMHLSDMDPDRPGLEVCQVHETPGPASLEFRDARTGAIIWGKQGTGDTGRGVAMDIDPRYRGYEAWAAGTTGGLYNAKGEQISSRKPSQMNFGVWWDADLLRELLDGTTISKWNWTTGTTTTLLSPAGVASNNGTKATPCLSADILGDWREEVIWRTADNTALRIYTTTIPATNRIYTLMHDPQYRLAVAWQNVAYNQPPHPGFFLGDGMSAPPTPNITTELAGLPTYFAHVAIGGGFSTVFTFPNTGADTADGSLILTDREGHPLSANLSSALIPSDSGGAGARTAAASIPLSVGPGATRIITASPAGPSDPTKTGWARLEMISGSLRGVATFQFSDGGLPKIVVGVPVSQPTDAATIPVDNDIGSNRLTAFAVANPGSEDLNIKVIILNQDGTVADSISPEELNPLLPQQQVAKFLHEILPGRLNFRGSMVLLSQGGKGFIAVALVENQGLFTAIPVLPAKSPTVPNY